MTAQSSTPLTVLSIDPGYDRVGWALGTLTAATSYQLLQAGCIQTNPKHSIFERYRQITTELAALCTAAQPQHCALESVFFSINKKTALRVSEARGGIISVLLQHVPHITEFTPTQIKQTVAGSGTADKASVKKMIELQLKLKPLTLIDDAVDAIAIGITHAVHWRSPIGNQKSI